MFDYSYDPTDQFGQPHRFVYVMRVPGDEANRTLAVIERWCADEFGPSPIDCPRWQHVGHSFWFRDEIDAVHFRTRW